MTPGLVERFEGAAKLDRKTCEPGPVQVTDRFEHAPADLAVPQSPTSGPLLVITADDVVGLRARTAVPIACRYGYAAQIVLRPAKGTMTSKGHHARALGRWID